MDWRFFEENDLDWILKATKDMFDESEWNDHQDALENGQLQLYYTAFVVKSLDQLMMVDTGMGPGPHPDRGNLTGDLYNAIRPVLSPPDIGDNHTNVSPSDQVNFVIHTHLHADHVGWILDIRAACQLHRSVEPDISFQKKTTITSPSPID